MMALVEAFSVALCMSSIFAFRYRMWRRPRVLAGYFSLFAVIEGVAHRYFLPEQAIVPATSYVCLGLSFVFIVVTCLMVRLERAAGETER